MKVKSVIKVWFGFVRIAGMFVLLSVFFFAVGFVRFGFCFVLFVAVFFFFFFVVVVACFVSSSSSSSSLLLLL